MNKVEQNWHPANYLAIFGVTLAGCAAIIGNCLLIFTLMHKIKARKSFELLILNASVTDLCMAIVNGCFEPYFSINFRSFGCELVGLLNFFFAALVLFQPPVILINRLEFRIIFWCKIFSNKNKKKFKNFQK